SSSPSCRRARASAQGLRRCRGPSPNGASKGAPSPRSRADRGTSPRPSRVCAGDEGPAGSPADYLACRPRGDPPAPPEEAGVALGEAFPPVGERDVELDDQMTVARLVHRAAGALAALDDTGERERGGLPPGAARLDPGPDRSTPRGGLAAGQPVAKTKPAGNGESPGR